MVDLARSCDGRFPTVLYAQQVFRISVRSLLSEVIITSAYVSALTTNFTFVLYYGIFPSRLI